MIYYTLMVAPEKLGIIDTLSAGFGVVNRRLWLIVIPLGLELLLWSSPRIQAGSLVNQAADGYRQLVLQSDSHLAAQEPENLEKILAEVERLSQPLGRFNLSYIAGWQMRGLLGAPDALSIGPGRGLVFDVADLRLLLIVVTALAGLGILVACVYLGAIAELVREGAINWAAYFGKIARNWLRLATYLLLLLVAALTLGPLGFLIIGLVGFGSPGVAGLLGTVAISMALWVMIYLFLTEEAIFVSGVNPVRAIWYSINVVRRNFWSAVGLFFITNIILLGISIALSLLFLHPLGVAAAMAANSYIATGLAVATMIYYQQRSSIWLGNKG